MFRHLPAAMDECLPVIVWTSFLSKSCDESKTLSLRFLLRQIESTLGSCPSDNVSCRRFWAWPVHFEDEIWRMPHVFQNVAVLKFSPPRWIRRGRWRGRLPRPNAQDRTKSVEDFWGKRWEKGTHQYALHPLKSLSLKCFEHKVWATLSSSESNAGWIWDWASDNAADTKWQVAQRHNRDRLETDVSNSKMFFLFKKITESHRHFHFLHWRLQFGQSCTTFPTLLCSMIFNACILSVISSTWFSVHSSCSSLNSIQRLVQVGWGNCNCKV